MGKKRYAIHRDFRLMRRFTPVVNRFTMSLVNIIIGMLPKFTSSMPNVRRERLTIPSFDKKPVKAYMFSPKEAEEKLPCLVYFHGGSFMIRGVFTHYTNVRQYAELARCRVLYVDYRLAPKHPFPIPEKDCFFAYKWALENAEKLGILRDFIAVGGDSAGGSLACSVGLLAKEHGYPLPCFMLLIYPVITDEMNTESMRLYTDTPAWNARLNRKMWELYLNGAKFHPPFVPDAAAPAYIETAEFDCLRDEGKAYYDFLLDCGCPAELNETKGTLHGYDFFRRSRITADSMAKRVNALKNAFYGASQNSSDA